MRRITGTTVYTYVACPRAAELDLHEDRSRRRALREAEELSRQRGRELEALRTAGLGYAEPSYERDDYGAGAAQTLALLRQGVAGVTQGVLADGGFLGIPDLLRREPGASALGDFHYVVGDVKSSAGARADQALQVAFYARLLEKVQGRPPSYGFLWLKDGREQRLPLADLQPVLDDVLERIAELAAARADARRERPFFQAGCRRCHWSDLCLAELRAREDLSLLAGMTRGLRATLEAAGITRPAELAAAHADRLVRRTGLEPALVRRIQLTARAFGSGAPLPVPDAPADVDGHLAVVACVHVLLDAFADRLLAVGARFVEAGRVRNEVRVPLRASAEWTAVQEVFAAIPAAATVLHWGSALPAWMQRAAHEHGADVDLQRRMVDVARRLPAAVVFPEPVFALRDAVRMGLGRDPDRAGDADAAPLWAGRVDAEARLRAKMLADLADLGALAERYLPVGRHSRVPAEDALVEQEVGE